MDDQTMRALVNALMAPNDFKPLTPEQKNALNKDAIAESWGPLDVFGGLGTATKAGLGLGAGLAPAVYKYMRRPDWFGMPTHNVQNALSGAALTGLFPAKLGRFVDGARDAYGRDVQRHQDSLLDAEGQPGGFYGRK